MLLERATFLGATRGQPSGPKVVTGSSSESWADVSGAKSAPWYMRPIMGVRFVAKPSHRCLAARFVICRQAFAVGVLLLVAPQLGCSRDPSSPGMSTDGTDGAAPPVDGAGTVGVALSLPGGENIDVVDWTIAGPAGAATVVKSGSAMISNSQSILFQIGNIPAGLGYTIALNATSTDGNVLCRSSAPTFDIQAQTTTSISVQLQCYPRAPDAGSLLVSGATGNCAIVIGISTSSNETTVGARVALSATAVGPDPKTLSYAWSAPSGSFGAPSSANTTFACTAVGPTPVTVTVGDGSAADGGSCDSRLDTATTVVQCDAPSIGSEVAGFAIDPAHDNAQPDDIVASPLDPFWTTQFDAPISYPLVAGGRVILAVSELNPNVEALDLPTGQLAWGPVVLGFPFTSPVTLAYDGGRVFVLNQTGLITALDAATGVGLWTTALSTQWYYKSAPVAAGGLVYVTPAGDTSVFAIDELTGAIVWTARTLSDSTGEVAVAKGVVYKPDGCGRLSALDAKTGQLNWFHAGSCTGGQGQTPSFYQDRIWLKDWPLTDLMVDTTGQTVGSFTADVVPAYHAGKAFLTTSFFGPNGEVSALDIQSGTLTWGFVGDGHICTSAVVAGGGGQVFVGSSLGSVYELDENTGAQRSMTTSGASLACSSGKETQPLALASGHLLVEGANTLTVY